MTSRELAGEWWFCMEHRRAEKLSDTDSSNRIGPFPTEDAAARALQTIADRNERYDQEDREWDR